MKTKLRLALLVFVAASGASSGLHAQTLAPGVRPGAARPEAPQSPPPPAAADLVEIPSVMERPLDVDEGPKVKVERFEFVGVEDYPAYGVLRTEVEGIASTALAKAGGTLTIGQMQAVADEISNYHREKGLVYATCIVPVQDVQGGVVKLELLIGRLGEVKVESNRRYTSNRIAGEFKNLIGQPIEQNSLESALIRLNDYPGLSVTGVVQPGKAIGDGALVARVQKERMFDGQVGVDSFGRKETGRLRMHGLANWNNPLGIGDRLSVFYQPTFIPQNQHFISGEYEVPLWGPKYTAKAYYRFNDFDIDQKGAGFEAAGRTTDGGIELAQHWLRGRVYNLSSFLGLARRDADTFINDATTAEDHITVANLRLAFDMADRRFYGYNSLVLEYRRGIPDWFGAMGDNRRVTSFPGPSRIGGSGNKATGSFDSVIFTADRLQQLDHFPNSERLNQLLNGHTLLFHGEVQWSDDLLVPFEQFAIGGISSVRGYQSSEVLFDRGVYLKVEYGLPWPFGGDNPVMFDRSLREMLRLNGFYDVAWGELNDPALADVVSDTLHSVGTSLEFRPSQAISMRLTLAAPVHDDDSKPDGRVWFDANYAF